MIAPNRDPYNPPQSDFAMYLAHRDAERAEFDSRRIDSDEWELEPREAFSRDLAGLRDYFAGIYLRYGTGLRYGAKVAVTLVCLCVAGYLLSCGLVRLHQ